MPTNRAGAVTVEFMLSYWYLFVLLIILVIISKFVPQIKGKMGEKSVSVLLSRLDEGKYKVFNNVVLQTNSGTTQIDHIVVSLYGVFVVETKNYSGYIFGDDSSKQWTQTLHGRKNHFYSPLKQNEGHIKNLKKALVNFPNLSFISIVSFSVNSTLKVKSAGHVIYSVNLLKTIRSYSDEIISVAELEAVVDTLQSVDLSSSVSNREHVKNLKDNQAKYEKAEIGGICPSCGEGTLINRQGKYGNFIGCTNYPKCRFIKKT
jgi:hypothetical protein